MLFSPMLLKYEASRGNLLSIELAMAPEELLVHYFTIYII